MTDDTEYHKVFCGNFPYESDLAEMQQLFEKYGDISHIDMKTGFCFVYFLHRSDGQASIDDLDGTEYGPSRRKLKLEWAKGDGRVKLREERRRANVTPNPTLFIVNFDPSATRESDFEDMFDRFGPLERVQIKKNFAFVQFKELEHAKNALEDLNGSIIKGRKITVEYVATAAEDRSRLTPPPSGRYEPRRHDSRERYDNRDRDRDRYRDGYRSGYDDRESYLRGPSNYRPSSTYDRARSPPPRYRDDSPRRRQPSPRPYRRERSPYSYRRRSRS